MTNHLRRTGRTRTAIVLVATAGCIGGGAAAAAGTVQADARRPADVTAVVSLTSPRAVGGPGIRVTGVLPGVGAELVRGTPSALATLARRPGVAGLRVDGPVRLQSAGFDAVSADGVFGWQGLGPDAGRPGAGHGATVAVVDTGISDTPALDRASGRLVDGVDTSPLVHDEDPLTTGTFTDGYGHGTFLASLLAGEQVPGSGRALGVAPGARVVSVKVADDTGRTSLSAVLAGLDWVATHRPIDVVTIALAAERPGPAYGADPLNMAVHHLRSGGLSVVVAAGNEAGDLGDPGFAPKAITIGAADTSGWLPLVAPFSGSGTVAGVDKPDLVASGVHLLGLLPEDSLVAQRFPDAQQSDGFWRGSGTSEATAVASGVAAMYVADHPQATPLDVKSALRGAARPVGGWPWWPARAGQGLLAVPTGDEVGNLGEGAFDRDRYWADGWDQPDWFQELAESWSTDVWVAKSWSTNPWAGDQWSAKSWSAKSWSAKSWSAKSWSVKSWSVKSWSITTGADGTTIITPYADIVDGSVGP